MNRRDELALLERCLKLQEGKTTQLSDTEFLSPVQRYLDTARFKLESDRLFSRLSVPYIHASQLAEPHSFVTLKTVLGSLLVTRDEGGQAHAFHNVCRHRGTRLVDEEKGCTHRFRCPYHAWTYNSVGELTAVPHGDSCFPTLDRSQSGLVELRCVEQHGFLWISPSGDEDADIASLPKTLHEDLVALDLCQLEIFAQDQRVWQANWKLIAEGGLESYHFKFAHKASIAPILWTISQFSTFLTSILERYYRPVIFPS